jgi:hypothetical protein
MKSKATGDESTMPRDFPPDNDSGRIVGFYGMYGSPQFLGAPFGCGEAK